jgi:hypothetical protein
MWNGSDDHAAGTWLLRTADARLQLAFELHKQRSTELAAEQPTDNGVGIWRRDLSPDRTAGARLRRVGVDAHAAGARPAT